jgi:hypothetical protein
VLRQRRPELIEEVARFFETRTDISRLGVAEKVAESILSIHGVDELAALRSIVAKQELMRHIKYERQIDHTAHTVYLYLLGVWFYDNVPAVRVAIDNQLSTTGTGTRTSSSPSAETKPIDDFLLVWSYASLLHDIGYVFYDLGPETQPDRKKVDSIFLWHWLERQFPKASPAASTMLKAIHTGFLKRYRKSMPPATATYAANAYEQVLNRLAAIPWVGDLTQSWVDLNGFQVLAPNEATRTRTKLQIFALNVARSGYDGAGLGRCVDHAVASGLLLLQYASYWYWLMLQVERAGKPDIAKEIFEGLDYKVTNLVHHIALACRACAYHNVRPGVVGADSILNEFRLDKSPLLFLSVLCDELQRWDRFAAGAGHLEHWQEYTQFSLESSHIDLRAQGGNAGATAEFRITSPVFKIAQLIQDLDTRLIDWRDVVDVVSHKAHAS